MVVQGVPCARRLGFVDLDFECSTVCLTLLVLTEFGRSGCAAWQDGVEHRNQSQPNPTQVYGHMDRPVFPAESPRFASCCTRSDWGMGKKIRHSGHERVGNESLVESAYTGSCKINFPSWKFPAQYLASPCTANFGNFELNSRNLAPFLLLNPVNGSPDNGPICLLVQLFASPILKYCVVKICR